MSATISLYTALSPASLHNFLPHNPSLKGNGNGIRRQYISLVTMLSEDRQARILPHSGCDIRPLRLAEVIMHPRLRPRLGDRANGTWHGRGEVSCSAAQPQRVTMRRTPTRVACGTGVCG
jgi:hypothetical protein